MAEGSGTVGNIQEFNFDVAEDRAASEARAENILAGREDLGRLQQMISAAQPTGGLNPIIEEKRMRDAEFAVLGGEQASPEIAAREEKHRAEETQRQNKESKLYQLGAELDKWKTIARRRQEDQKGLEQRLKVLEASVQQNQPVLDVRQMTGKNQDDVLTAGEVTQLMLSLAGAFGQQMNQLRTETAQYTDSQKSKAVSDVDEAELTYMHPWLETLPVAQRERAMLDILASRHQPVAPEPPPQPTNRQIEQARSQVREANFIETSNRASRAEVTMQDPQVVARQQKIDKLNEILMKPGGSAEAGELLAALGAGPDDAEAAYMNRRRL